MRPIIQPRGRENALAREAQRIERQWRSVDG